MTAEEANTVDVQEYMAEIYSDIPMTGKHCIHSGYMNPVAAQIFMYVCKIFKARKLDPDVEPYVTVEEICKRFCSDKKEESKICDESQMPNIIISIVKQGLLHIEPKKGLAPVRTPHVVDAEFVPLELKCKYKSGESWELKFIVRKHMANVFGSYLVVLAPDLSDLYKQLDECEMSKEEAERKPVLSEKEQEERMNRINEEIERTKDAIKSQTFSNSYVSCVSNVVKADMTKRTQLVVTIPRGSVESFNKPVEQWDHKAFLIPV